MPGITYDVVVRELFEDRASSGLAQLNRNLDSSAKHADGLKNAIAGAATFIAGAFGAREAFHSLVSFNAEVEQTKIGLSAIINMNVGGTFSDAQKQADSLFQEFQRFSQAVPVTTQQMTEFSSGVASAVFAAGGKMEDLVNITEMGTVAAQVFGIESHLAQIQLTEMLSGNIRKTERFTMALLNAGHMSAEAFRELDANQRRVFIEGAINSNAMKEALTAMSGSFAGVTTTLKDLWQIFAGGVGLPLFKAITAEVKHWNEWIGQNQKMLDVWAKDFSAALMSGFATVKDAVMWIVDHRQMLLTIAEAFLALKGISLATGAVSGIAGLMKEAGVVATALSGTNGALKQFTVGLGGVAIGLTAVAVGAKLLADYFDGEQTKRIERQSEAGGLRTTALDLQKGNLHGGTRASMEAFLASQAMGHGYMTAGGLLNQKKLLSDLPGTGYSSLAQEAGASQSLKRMLGGGMTVADAALVRSGQPWNSAAASADQLKALLTIADLIALSEARRVEATGKMLQSMDLIAASTENMANMKWMEDFRTKAFGGFDEGVKKSPTVNVTIQRIEVQSNDPDRFVFGLSEIGRSAVQNPSSAKRTLPEG